MKNISKTLLCLFTATSLSALGDNPGTVDGEMVYGTLEVERVHTVISGDYFLCDLKIVHDLVGHRIPVQVYDIKSPDSARKESKALRKAKAVLTDRAIDFTSDQITNATVLEIRNVRRSSDSFEVVADVYVDDVSLKDLLIAEKLAQDPDGFVDWETFILTHHAELLPVPAPAPEPAPEPTPEPTPAP